MDCSVIILNLHRRNSNHIDGMILPIMEGDKKSANIVVDGRAKSDSNQIFINV